MTTQNKYNYNDDCKRRGLRRKSTTELFAKVEKNI